MSDKKAWTLFACGIVLCLCALSLGLYFKACAKAGAYNRLTGSHVTPWDAMVLDLRVQAPPKAE